MKTTTKRQQPAARRQSTVRIARATSRDTTPRPIAAPDAPVKRYGVKKSAGRAILPPRLRQVADLLLKRGMLTADQLMTYLKGTQGVVAGSLHGLRQRNLLRIS